MCLLTSAGRKTPPPSMERPVTQLRLRRTATPTVFSNHPSPASHLRPPASLFFILYPLNIPWAPCLPGGGCLPTCLLGRLVNKPSHCYKPRYLSVLSFWASGKRAFWEPCSCFNLLFHSFGSLVCFCNGFLCVILWPPHAKSWLIGKDPDAGRDWGQEEKGTTEDEMSGWHHRLDGHEFG